MGLPLNLQRFAGPLLTMSNWFNGMGSADGGMHMVIAGEDLAGAPHTRSWFIIAKDGDGPHIPAIPAIVLAKQLVRNELDLTGAMPCVGLVSMDAYVQELASYEIYTRTL